MLRRAGAGDRRLHRAEGQPHRPRRAAAGPLRGRAPALRGQGRHRLHPRHPARPRRAARAAAPGRARRSPTRSASAAPPGCGRASWRRSASPSGRATGACATRASWGCATTRRRRRWCASERRDRQGGPAAGGDQPRRPGRLPRGGPDQARPRPPLRDRGRRRWSPTCAAGRSRCRASPRASRATGYFLKDAPRPLPRLDRDVAVPKREGGTIDQVLADDVATLVYLAGPERDHAARLDRPRRPPRAARPPDLRPRPLERSASARCAPRPARAGDLLRDARPRAVRDDHRLARAARGGARCAAPPATTRSTPSPAGGRRPSSTRTPRPSRSSSARPSAATGSTSTSPATPTASTPWRPTRCGPCRRAPVATPLRWEELDDDGLDPQGWTVATIGDRLDEVGDPWARDRAPRPGDRPGPPGAGAALGEEAHHLRGEEVGRGVHRGVALAGQHDDP